MAPRKPLSDAQQLILSNAATHPDHGIFPLPVGFRARGAVRQKVLAALLKQGFVTERPTADDDAVWRRDTRRHRLTLIMTAQGCRTFGLSAKGVAIPKGGLVTEAQQIGRDGHTHGDGCGSNAAATSASATDIVGAAADTTVHAPAAVPAGKLGSVLSALATDHGATLAALVTLTGWLPHTTRAALCRLRQRGYSIQLVGDAGSRAYRLDIPAQG